MSDKQSAWRSPWVIAWVGILVVFVLVSGVRVYIAVVTNPGLVDEDFYERGQEYEKNLRKRMARDPGWKMRIEAPRFVDLGKPTRFSFSVTDKDGVPVDPDSVTFYAYRPSDASKDFSLPMQLVEAGYYQAEVAFPLLGAWDILVSAKRGEDEFNVPHRLSARVN